jgi:tetratricopeptide (TPR) repeat protein
MPSTSIEAAVSVIYSTFILGDLGDLEPEGNSTETLESWLTIRKAWHATGAQRGELAHRALEIFPQCADAYLILAQESSPDLLFTAKSLYEQALETCQSTLGPSTFENCAGRFWKLIPQTRPYMRARAGLARCLWLLAQRQQAIEHYCDMLRLNPGDNQGVRYLLLAHTLLQPRTDKQLAALIENYKYDDSAFWLYTNSLRYFRRARASITANRALKKALKATAA